MKISTTFFKIIAFFVLILSAFSSQLHAQTVSFTSAAVAQANENISNVYTAQASTTSGTIVYSLETGGDESLLTINSSTGLVTLKLGYIDYETKTVYNFTVKATAGSTSVTQAVRVDIINAIVEGGSLNSKKFQLSPALLQNYLEDGVIDLYDDNPSFSGKGVSGNQVYIEIFKDPTTLSYATMRMSCPYTSSGTCASIFGSNYDGSTVSLPANNMGSYPFSGRGGGWQGGAVVDSNGNWSTNFGQTSNFQNMGGVDFWGEKDAPSQGIGKGYWVLEPGDMLYLPPNMAHDGIAVDAGCQTWSVGFKVPNYKDLISEILWRTTEALENDPKLNQLYKDPQQRAIQDPALVPQELIDSVYEKLNKIHWSKSDISCTLASILSEPKPQTYFIAPQSLLDLQAFKKAITKQGISLSPLSKILHDQEFYYLNGESVSDDTEDDWVFWKKISINQALTKNEGRQLSHLIDDVDNPWFEAYSAGWLTVGSL